MDLMAMRTGKSRAIKLGPIPGGFFDSFAGGSEAAGRGAADQDPFDDGTSGWFYGAGKFEFTHQSR